MKPSFVVSGLVVFAGSVAAGFFWPRSSAPAVPASAHVAPGSGAGTAGTVATGATTPGNARPADRGVQAQAQSRSPKPLVGAQGRVVPGEAQQMPGAASVTARGASAGRGATSESGGTPRVSARLAFKALLYVGVDPEAEKTWMRAINDPNLPEGVRSDLIEDLNDEGYEDPSGNHITKKDLPLILARLEIIERLAPYAMDKVNADAFQEAYKDLLNMYVRLGGGKRK